LRLASHLELDVFTIPTVTDLLTQMVGQLSAGGRRWNGEHVRVVSCPKSQRGLLFVLEGQRPVAPFEFGDLPDIREPVQRFRSVFAAH